MKISLLHPSRGRPQRSFETISKWIASRSKCGVDVEIIISLDEDDPTLEEYQRVFNFKDKDYRYFRFYANENKSSVEAINLAARSALGDVFMVVSDDTEPSSCWDCLLEKEMEGKTDWILKTKDGIQEYIITNPIMDRTYYNRFGYIYHPDYVHLFCDTYMTCVADITGRKITSNLLFKHNHYSVGGSVMDEVNKKNDATWKQGEETFIRLMKQFTPEERNRISDQGMKNWLRNHGV